MEIRTWVHWLSGRCPIHCTTSQTHMYQVVYFRIHFPCYYNYSSASGQSNKRSTIVGRSQSHFIVIFQSLQLWSCQFRFLSVNYYDHSTSVTRFGEISPLRQNFNSLFQYLRAYLVFGKIVILPRFYMPLGKLSLLYMAKN